MVKVKGGKNPTLRIVCNGEVIGNYQWRLEGNGVHIEVNGNNLEDHFSDVNASPHDDAYPLPKFSPNKMALLEIDVKVDRFTANDAYELVVTIEQNDEDAIKLAELSSEQDEATGLVQLATITEVLWYV